MTNTLSQKDRDAMANLKDYAERSFKSKPTLRIMQSLFERDLIVFDPFTAHAELTDKGRKALNGT